MDATACCMENAREGAAIDQTGPGCASTEDPQLRRADKHSAVRNFVAEVTAVQEPF
jgi:hypothetical protein